MKPMRWKPDTAAGPEAGRQPEYRQRLTGWAAPALRVVLVWSACSSLAQGTEQMQRMQTSGTSIQLVAAAGTMSKLDLDFEGAVDIVEDNEGEGAEISSADQPTRGPRPAPGAALLGTAIIQFQGGDASQRTARVVDDPARPGNRVLEFMLRAPNVKQKDRLGAKSRIQMNVYGNRSVAELYQSVRLKLGPDFELLKKFEKPIDWFTISEWWNNAGWTREPFPFRISVNISKPQPGLVKDLFFSVKAQAKSLAAKDFDVPVWAHTNVDFRVPIGRWMTIEYYFKEGDGQTGRFLMAVTPDGDQRSVVVDVTGFTRHPDNPRNDGLSHFNPIKLYTSLPLTEFIRSRGGSFQMFWDDLSIRACGQTAPTLASECASLARLR